ncbi:DUF3316 domain-containing protein [Dysgonomonas sp. 25]|uniref:DUF3316 domain-containing protein n=1 Tax=Dysgonomonas sp. 25 TaxID=2302933 RepID=UPI0013D5942D|nr:DUF3316 domain-containing protein [Dysgonomonas sp. 25]NDV67817.1 DUF3316 domain-containing protein [Dysgonomonas sp. 25]
MKKQNRFLFLLLTLLFLLCGVDARAQENDVPVLPNPVNSATMIAIGNTNLYDTYLSPLKYKGTSIRVMNERMNRLSWFDGKFVKQQVIDLELAIGDNPAKTASEYWLMLNYRLGGHYDIWQAGDFKLRAGGIWDASLGVLYNERNGNNPASARAYTNLNFSVIGIYSWKDFTFRWQMDTPFAGIMFSPRFGQSYYEISLGNSVGNVNFASFHNQRALRNYITVDFPVWKFTVRAGYLGSFYQTKVHSINTHTYSNSFVIGLVKESINLSGGKAKDKRYINSCYY